MRRVTVHKSVAKSAVRRERKSRETQEGTDRQSRERPEVRRDVLRVWWPNE
ncbi:hypothetical protein [Streptomyces typhae]|uniref:hypothetical protein n=1 Tax=Streptomyces typhae TaxID=2681492 RepID=UPI0018E055F0|nr:hypothetical protein [Streptomyces typhae]